MIRRLPRVVSATLVAGALLGGLSACYVGPANTDCVPKASAGTASNAVSASGTVLSQPDVTFPTPLRPKKTEVSVLQAGEGTPIQGDQFVSGYLTILNGTTGDVLDQSDYGAGTPSSFVIDKLPIAGLKKGLQCAEVGSRVAVVVPGKEAFSDDSRPAGIAKDDSLVVVVDFKDAFLARAQGIAQVAQEGLPSVVLAPDGRPGITIPAADPPKKLQVADLISGNGRKVKSGDSVLVNYTGVLWKEGTVFDSSWQNGAPITIKATKGQAIPGFLDALKGAQVGDQILAVIPPDQAYGDQASGSVPAGSTLVFVIDVLGIVK
ncbi:FKBP-type peptidyl-prolyl cis-trans isomerase [Naasia aerilata]|uniref:Peptidyl-prolyl cis-trans isomerase n=1 Tax=Naasia aerilata TaxID=1162966 RepID=A0ABN6XQJ1_9MICO|nr:FKBP-type peptidyl-prolyl cis-trans isomerase [Naasia aerilata]BDZ47275.1 peptidylprolyl isomerase [Naasia aerilata]